MPSAKMNPKVFEFSPRGEHYQIPVVDDLLPDLTDACVFT